jgi:hypothetical protein
MDVGGDRSPEWRAPREARATSSRPGGGEKDTRYPMTSSSRPRTKPETKAPFSHRGKLRPGKGVGGGPSPGCWTASGVQSGAERRRPPPGPRGCSAPCPLATHNLTGKDGGPRSGRSPDLAAIDGCERPARSPPLLRAPGPAAPTSALGRAAHGRWTGGWQRLRGVPGWLRRPVAAEQTENL